jgi:tyrosine-protein kinase Src
MGMSAQEVRHAVVEQNYRMRKPTKHNVPDDIYQVMLNCWDQKPEARPTFEYLHSYFENYQGSSGPIPENLSEISEGEITV